MKRFFTLAAIFATLFATAQEQPQPVKYCGTNEAMEKLQKENPAYIPNELKVDESQAKSQQGQVYIIPVVFHIVHNYGVENISDAQVEDAIRILNLDFRKMNSDTGSVIPQFKSIAGDAEIEFRLAQKDPQGNCTNGIIRRQSLMTYSADEDIKNSNVAPGWGSPRYMNVWVVNSIASGAAGYTFKPSSWMSPDRDGILILHDYVGAIGTGQVGRSRALTHEVGHWLNLSHTWGNTNNPGVSSNCNSDDGISDTPNTIGWTSCNLNGSTCNSLDNVQNYMDYSYCSNMFTQGQINVMRNALNSSVGTRNQLWTTSNLNATGTAGPVPFCKADFSSNTTYVCQGDQVQFTDESYSGQTSWNWSFPGGTPSSSTAQNPVVTYSTPGNYSVTLTAGDGSSNDVEAKSSYISVLPSAGIPQPVNEGFESATIDPNRWVINNQDGGFTWVPANVGATGSWSAKMNNYYGNGGTDEMISVPYDLSGLSSATVTFKVAYAPKNNGHATEYLRFYVSNNCGDYWMIRWGGSSTTMATAPATNAVFTPTASQWKTITITNIPSSYLTSGFMFKFAFEGKGGNNVYVDDINIGANPGVEEAASSIAFDVYPNPLVDGSIALVNLESSSQATLTMRDITGRTVREVYAGALQAGENRINLPSNLAAGVYMLLLNTDGVQTVKRVVVN